MEQIEYMLELLHDNHPIWYWVLMRLAICVLWSLFGAAILACVLLFFAPFVMVMEGSGGSAFWLWLIEPVLCVQCWGFASAADWLSENML